PEVAGRRGRVRIRIDAAPGALGAMIRMKRKTVDRFVAQAYAQRVVEAPPAGARRTALLRRASPRPAARSARRSAAAARKKRAARALFRARDRDRRAAAGRSAAP